MNGGAKFFIELFTYCMPLLLIAGVIIGLFRFLALNAVHRLLLGYLAMALIIDVLSRIFGIVMHNNLLFIPLFGFLELAFFTWLYFRYFLPSQSRFLLIVPVIGLGFIAWEFYQGEWMDPLHFNAYSRVVDPVTVVFLCMLHFREIGNAVPLAVERMRMNSAILLFFSLNLVFFLPVNFLINVPSQLKFYFWLANLILTMAFYTFLIFEIWKNGKTRPSLVPGS
ncbi:MAG: hypothetical protein JWP12_1224 [Bacteroidetes bacterium]|nr:hypothetical protein [Bacteroidota bacterium]